MADFLSLCEIKARLHIDFEDDDGELLGYLDAAESILADPNNGILRRAVVSTEFVETFGGFECVSLAFPDEISASSVTYTDTDGDGHTLDDIYTVDDGALVLNYGETWPTGIAQVTVTYSAGWDSSSVPAAITGAGYFYARSLYEQGAEVDENRLRKMISLMVSGYRRATL